MGAENWAHKAARYLVFGVSGVACIGYLLLCYVAWSLQSPAESVRLTDQSRGSSPVFLRFQSLGISGELVAISANPDACDPIDPSVEYVFRDSGMRDFVYRLDGGELHVYHGETRPSTPSDASVVPVTVTRHPRYELPYQPSDPAFRANGFQTVPIRYQTDHCMSYPRVVVTLPRTVWLVLRQAREQHDASP